MKIHVVAVGKVKEACFADGIKEYCKRLARFCQIDVTEIREETFFGDPSPAERLRVVEEEGVRILRALKGRVVALCVEGERLSSEEFSKIIAKERDAGGELTFVIGGSYGLSESVKSRAFLRLSFSDMTFPHTLMRLILSEQIYRAFMIDAGSPYHK